MPSLTIKQSNAAGRNAAQVSDHDIRIVRTVCKLAGAATLIDDVQAGLRRQGVLAAIRKHDTAALFEWFLATISYQGISDRAAEGFMHQHGRVRWADIAAGLARSHSCPKLRSYWGFNGCGYAKAAGTCGEPDHIAFCPLPTHRLRNGRLNQAAYSIFMFMRDVADGDLVGWIDGQLASASVHNAPGRVMRMRDSLIEPLSQIHGVSQKTLALALSTLLIGGSARKPFWLEVGGSMIAIDTLVHNFLHRTGILRRRKAEHPYGTRCYEDGGCADIVAAVSEAIDAREFNRQFPRNFPRFVQNAIWRYCAQLELDVCNGNRIDDRKRCENFYCRLYPTCDRVKLS